MRTRLGHRLFLTAAAAAGAVSAARAEPAPLLGFSGEDGAAERALEARFDAGLSAAAIGERLKLMSAAPNQVGSPHDKANAEYTLARFKAWGWDAHIETFSVLYPTPKVEKLELTGPAPYQATLTEPPIAGDASSARQAGGLPAYLAYGGDGDVTAPLIYVNYGMPADYAELQRQGQSAQGKIVIVRYGAGWRGLKPKLAAEHGAIGCIIYSDPADDGYGAGDPYPAGAFRPESGIQRGSVMDMPVEAGDPLTPDIGATAKAHRIARSDAKTILSIPTLPISWGEARHFLAALTGETAPKGWRGALPITYHIGPSAAAVHMAVQSDWSQKPLYDVIAVMLGSREPDQWVVRGNHRDGWVFGAQDPLSGQTALMEEAKSLGALAKTGWRPARTIVYASWDGEEPGLLGSTEWAEEHAQELHDKAIVYINTDGNDRGILSAEASYSLRRLVDQAAADVADPETGASVRARAMARLQVDGLAPDASAEAKANAKLAMTGADLPLGDLGSGSDYSSFVEHLGIAAINLGFRGEGQSGGVYHSAYDTYEHFERFGDPGFVYGVTLAKTTGRLVLRAADADLAPLYFTDLAATVRREVEDLKKLVSSEREHAEAVDRLLDENAFKLAADPTRTSGPPDRETLPTMLDFSPLEVATERLTVIAATYDRAVMAGAPADRAKHADLIVQGVEQALTDARGLPGRSWYKHLIYAPGLLTGYGSKTLPGVREAIEARRWAEAADYIRRTAAVLEAASNRIEEATRALAS